VLFPLGLIILAVASGFAVAYGTDARWMQYSHGLSIIVDARRFQWPLVCLSLIACIGLLALVVSARRRAWWLIGLAPVLALFAHRFAFGPAAAAMAVVENPDFVTVADVRGIADDDYVVGLTFGDKTYAYPYAQLYWSPVIVQSDHEKRMMLIWSAYANRALAFNIHHDLKPRELEVVSTPANALLLYDGRLGQFINGITGQTTKGQKPTSFGSALITQKMPWRQWRALHPQTSVMVASASERQRWAGPTKPLLPTCPMPPMTLDHPKELRIAMVGTTQPAAIESDAVGAAPINLRADDLPVFIFREIPEQPIRGFARQIKADLFPRFVLNRNPRKHPNAMFVDVDTTSGWDSKGAWTDGLKDLKGKKLQSMAVDDDLSYGVMKFWYPELQLQMPQTQPSDVSLDDEPQPQTQPNRRGRGARRPRNAPTNPRPQR
jgi:hypothetical protein